MQRDQSVTVRVSAFEKELLRLIESEPAGRMRGLKQSPAVQIGVLYAAYQRCGAGAVARARKKFGLEYADMVAMYLDPEDSLRALERHHLEVDGIVSAE